MFSICLSFSDLGQISSGQNKDLQSGYLSADKPDTVAKAQKQSKPVSTGRDGAGSKSGLQNGSRFADRASDAEDDVDMSVQRSTALLDDKSGSYKELPQSDSTSRQADSDRYTASKSKSSKPQDDDVDMSVQINSTLHGIVAENMDEKARENGQVAEQKMPFSRPNMFDPLPPASETNFTALDIFLYVFCIVSYLGDVGSDIWVAHQYYDNGDVWWFSLTVIFIVVPALVTTAFSLSWYCRDHLEMKKHDPEHRMQGARWTSRFIFLFLQLGPIIR